MEIYPDLAHKAIKEKIADPLGMEVAEAAWSMRRVIDHAMVDGISMVSIQRGEDPRRYTLVVAGGAGAVHAASLARALGVKRLLAPRTSSVFCALGGVIADVRHDFVRSVISRVSQADPEMLSRVFAEMRALGDSYLEREGIAPEDRYYQRFIDMRYKGQYHELQTPVDREELDREAMEDLVEEFHRMHQALYSYRDSGETEMLNLRLAACGRVHTPPMGEGRLAGPDGDKRQKAARPVFFAETGGFVDTPIYDGEALEAGVRLEGPAVVELKTASIVAPPGSRVEVTPFDSFLVELTD